MLDLMPTGELLTTVAGNWPLLVILVGAIAVFSFARKQIGRAKSDDVKGDTGSKWVQSDFASDDDLLAKYPPPGAEPAAPAAKRANLDDFFSNTA
ncbi:MAG TPA: hypothetical protein VLA37_11155, partial [Sphingomonadaceae bacterium]|nr:hypothetical protein [Sphingomonadaceae bacterium]